MSDVAVTTRSKWREPRLWIAFASLVLVGAMAISSSGRRSPGELSTVHGRIAELAGESNCSACHGGWFGSMSQACLDCHDVIGEQLEDGSGLHGRLGAEGNQCASCHSEHHGPSFDLIGRRSFSKAGVPDPAKFDHALIGFEMSGKHLELSCAECHEHAGTTVLPEGARRFIGLSQDCAACHEDPHEGALAARSCADCHVQDSFDRHVSRGHERHLPLIGGHGEIGCRTCHEDGTRHALERAVRRAPPARTCLDCHDSPHGEAFETAHAARTGKPAEAACADCHRAEHDQFRDPRLVLDPVDHAASGLALIAPHAELACEACHDPARETYAERHPGRHADSCAACHEDPHAGQFATGPFAEQGCVACHGREHFTPHGFGVELHARSALPLEGSHLEAECDACHQKAHADAPRTFRGTPMTCAGCHADAHAGFFDARTQALEPLAHGDCARCHQATAFADVSDERFDHGRWTGFPIGGAHDVEGCEACHASAHQPDATGRRFGRVAERFGPLEPLHGGPEVGRACSLCHQDPHAGRFDAPGLPARHEDREGCARCHGDASFRDLPHGFDHGLWTGFPLSGAHAAAACSDCHAPLWPPDERGRSWQPAKGAACADCHADPHGGQLAREGRTDCARCHKDPSSFERRTFDHDWDTRFPLDANHRPVACEACHPPADIGGVRTFRYRPLGTACTDCHGVQAGSLRRRGSDR